MKKECFKRCIGSSLYDELLVLEGLNCCYRNLIDDLIKLRCTGCHIPSCTEDIDDDTRGAASV